jgi:hypothetical protein
VPPAVIPAGSVPAGVQVAPPSIEIPKWMEPPLGLPARTITLAASSAKSIEVVDPKVGLAYISPGRVKSWCTKPPTSPTAESRCAPVGGLIRSRTVVSSNPRARTEMRTPPLSQSPRLSVP